MTAMTRRAAISATLATAAATPGAIAATATASEPDPVFVLLEQHREASARRDALGEQDGYDEKAFGALDDPVIEIERQIINTVPTSLAGIRAVLALAIGADGGDIAADDDDRDCLFANLVEALDQHIGGADPRRGPVARDRGGVRQRATIT